MRRSASKMCASSMRLPRKWMKNGLSNAIETLAQGKKKEEANRAHLNYKRHGHTQTKCKKTNGTHYYVAVKLCVFRLILASRNWECQIQPCRNVVCFDSIHAMPLFWFHQVDNKFLLRNFLSDYKIFVSNSACYSFSDHLRYQTEVVKIIAVFEIAPHINMLSRCSAHTQNARRIEAINGIKLRSTIHKTAKDKARIRQK